MRESQLLKFEAWICLSVLSPGGVENGSAAAWMLYVLHVCAKIGVACSLLRDTFAWSLISSALRPQCGGGVDV